MRVRLVLGLFFSLIYSSLTLAESGYIHARQAQLYSAPSLQAMVLAVAHKGDVVEIALEEGRWLKVGSAPPQG